LAGSDDDRHGFHGAHAETRDGFVADEEEFGSGAGDDLALNLVRGRPEDGPPQAGRERRDQQDEDDDQQPAGAGR
jgi:hypothetical protein